MIKDIKDIKAIDVHSHLNTGNPYDHEVFETYDGSLEFLIKMYKAANVEKIFCSPFAAVLNSECIIGENEVLFNLAQEVDMLYQWVVIDPRNDETFEQASKMLNRGKCVGIKLHPVEHKYNLCEYLDKVSKFATEYNAIIQIHPDGPTPEYLKIVDKYPEVTYIMAHMGSQAANDPIVVSKAKHGNVYLDTSSAASADNMAIEYTVDRIGSDRILFGTDTYSAGFQRGRIEYGLMSDKDKENILRGNAEKLFARFLK